MIEILITLLAIGFVMYYLVRHPLRSLKYMIVIPGLLLLGVIGVFGFFYVLMT